MVAVPAVDAVNVEVQVAVPAVVPAASVQVVNVPVTPLTVNVTDPVGVLTVPAAVSVTVAVHVEPWLKNTGLENVTNVWCVHRYTITLYVVAMLYCILDTCVMLS